MIHEPQHTIVQATPLKGTRLELTFADHYTAIVDLAAVARKHKALRALGDPKVFAKAHRDARGGYVVWIEDDLEIAADNLRDLAVEQGGDFGAGRMIAWQQRHGLTQEQAAQAIGVSRRMLNYYLSGAKPTPRTVWLACLGWEATQAAHAA